MCIAFPGEIIGILGSIAKVNLMGVDTEINIDLIENPCNGDYVLIHAGCAIEKINKAYFDEVYNIFGEIMNEDECINE